MDEYDDHVSVEDGLGVHVVGIPVADIHTISREYDDPYAPESSAALAADFGLAPEDVIAALTYVQDSMEQLEVSLEQQ